MTKYLLLVVFVAWIVSATVIVRYFAPRFPPGLEGMRKWRRLLFGLMVPTTLLAYLLAKSRFLVAPVELRRTRASPKQHLRSISREGTWFYLTDVQFSVVALIDDIAVLSERVRYDALPAKGGRARHR